MMTLIKKNSFAGKVLFLLFFLAICLPGFVFLRSDSDSSLSYGIYADEGYKTFNARNRVLFGKYFWNKNDEYEGWYKRSPVMTGIYIQAFNFFGVNLLTIRVVAAIFTVFSIFLIYLISKKFFRDKKHLKFLSVSLAGFSYIYFTYGRIGFFEIPANVPLLLIVMGCFLFLDYYNRNREIRENLLGYLFSILLIFIGIVFSYKIKLTSLISIIAILGGAGVSVVIIEIKRNPGFSEKTKVKIIRYLISGLIIIFFSSLLLFSSFECLRGMIYASRPFSPVLITFLSLLKTRFIAYNPIIFLFAGIFSLYTIAGYTKNNINKMDNNQTGYFDLIFVVWFLLSSVITISLVYHPLRYFLHAYVPMFFCAARFITEKKEIEKYLESKKTIIQRIILFFLLIISASSLLFSVSMGLAGFYHTDKFVHALKDNLINLRFINIFNLCYPVFIGGVLIVMLFIVRKKIVKKVGFNKIIMFFLCIYFLCQSMLFGKWLLTNEQSIFRLSGEITKFVGEDRILAGSMAPSLGVENRIRTIYINANEEEKAWNLYNLRKIKPDFLIISGDSQFGKIKKIYPLEMSRARLIKKYHLGVHELKLYALKW